MRIGLVGCGHVGLTTGVCLAFCGHEVVGLDVDEERVAALRAGRLPFYEPLLDKVLARARPNLTFTFRYEDLAEMDACIVAVPSPNLGNGQVDLSYLRRAAAGLAEAIGRRHAPRAMLVINKSTLPVGSARLVEEEIVARLEALVPAGSGPALAEAVAPTVCSCPEFLREGLAVQDTLYPDRLVFGVDRAEDGALLRELYGPIIHRSFPDDLLSAPDGGTPRVVETTVVSAELIKYASNAFLATKISFINEMARIAELVGADVTEVAAAIGLDRRIGQAFLNAGIGWGGSCFGKDLDALLATAAEYGLEAPLLTACVAVNRRQRMAVVRILQEELRVLKGMRVGLLGLAFKPGTDDLRDAPSLDIAERLAALGATVSAYDPVVKRLPGPGPQIAASVAALAAGSDALVLVTEWDEFARLPWDELARAMRRPLLVDGRNALDPATLRAAGFRYRGIGR